MITLDYFFNAAVVIFVLLGLFFFFTATLGLLRFPDFYCKLQAIGKGDTLGGMLILFGVVLYVLKENFTLDTVLVSLKILIIIYFIFLANPTATHAITKAGIDIGITPITKEDLKK